MSEILEDDVNFELDNLRALDLGLGSSRTRVRSLAIPYPYYQGELTSIGIALPHNGAINKTQNQLPSFMPWDGSPTPISRYRSISSAAQVKCRTHSCCAVTDEGQGQFTSSHNHRATSPSCHMWWGGKGRGPLPFTHTTSWQMSGRVSSGSFSSSRLTHLCPWPALLSWSDEV